MTARHFILATAGHIDHGKSALVQKLTGVDPDRLPEEKRRGMTIDLGFAEFRPNPALSIGIVDVPGHEDFVKTMVAGVGTVDAVLLAVAADDGWMPQSEEHLQILEHLNVRRGVIALTKSDRIETGKIADAIRNVRRQVIGTFLADSPIVPTTIHSGDGLERLRMAIVAMFDGMQGAQDLGKPRLQIDRSFLLRGVGRVVTGSLSGGTLARGQSVMLAPAMVASRIRAIQSHNRDAQTAGPGTRVALQLSELPATGEWRGQTLTLESLATPHDVIDVLLHQSIRAKGGKPLKRNMSIQVHHGTQAVHARIIPFRDPAFAQLRLESPLVTFIGDRLVLRDAAQRNTIAGATVLDPTARRSGMQIAERMAYLSTCASGINDVETSVGAILTHRKIVRCAELIHQSHFSQNAIDAAVTKLLNNGSAISAGGLIIERERWDAMLQQLIATIRAFHGTHPEQPGIPLAMLRQAVQAGIASSDLVEMAIDDLVSRGFIRLQSYIRDPNHQPRLPARMRSSGDRLRATLAACQLDPPPRNELTPDATAQQALAFLKTTGEVIELSPQVIISATAFSTAVSRVRGYLEVHKSATVTELKTAMGTSRRVAVPLLEKLDQAGTTRREGDRRQLK